MAAVGVATACGSGGSSGGLSVLGASSPPAPSASASPASGSSPEASPQPTFNTDSPGASPSVAAGDSSPAASPAASPALSGTESPSPSASPTYLDPASEFEAYLAAVKPIRMSFHRLALQLDHVIWKDAHKYIDATWPPAGRKVYRLSKKMDKMRVDWDVVVPPATLVKAHAAYLSCMRANQLAYQKIAFYLVNKLNWSEDSANGRRVRALWNKAARTFDVFKHKVMVQSRQLDVKVPWKW